MLPPGYVYFVHAPGTGLIKIGYTHNFPDVRFDGLQAGSPIPLERVAWVRGFKDQEVKLHRMFQYIRKHSEWFLYNEDIRAYIKEHGQKWTITDDTRERNKRIAKLRRDKAKREHKAAMEFKRGVNERMSEMFGSQWKGVCLFD